MCRRIINSIPVFYPLDARSTHLPTPNVFKQLQLSPGGQNYPRPRITGLDPLFQEGSQEHLTSCLLYKVTYSQVPWIRL